MAIVNRLTEIVGEETGPTAYECPECDRRFEVDAPPERVVCSACGNGDVRQVDA